MQDLDHWIVTECTEIECLRNALDRCSARGKRRRKSARFHAPFRDGRFASPRPRSEWLAAIDAAQQLSRPQGVSQGTLTTHGHFGKPATLRA